MNYPNEKFLDKLLIGEKKMKVLVVGTGAREHAICDALIKDDVELYAYMSKNNPGISKISTFKKGDEGEVDEVAKFAKENEIELAVIGP